MCSFFDGIPPSKNTYNRQTKKYKSTNVSQSKGNQRIPKQRRFFMANNQTTQKELFYLKQIEKIRKEERDFNFYASLMQPGYNSKQSTKHRTDEYIGFLNYNSKHFGTF